MIIRNSSLLLLLLLNFLHPLSLAVVAPVATPPAITIPVPAALSRFNIPWRTPSFPKIPNVHESRGRLLYSGVREAVSDGLGHGMATTNADLTTALRLGITYTHRVAKYGSLVGNRFSREVLSRNHSDDDAMSRIAGLSSESGQIEGFFGWGVGEIPREAIQDAACDFRNEPSSIGHCKLCTEEKRQSLKLERKNGRARGLRVDQIVEIPMSLSYKHPHRVTKESNQTLQAFLKEHNKPYTVFHMPHEVCAKSPAYSKFLPESRSFFYHKYWAAHAMYPPRDPRKGLRVNSSLRLYRDSWVSTLRIPGVPSRGTLPRLNEHELTIAVHARRGDFFAVGRPMVSTASFARVIRQVVSEIQTHGKIFARMPIAIHIYSEGKPKKGYTGAVGHDVKRLTDDFHDADGKVLDAKAVSRIFKDKRQDDRGNVFRRGLRVLLHVSQDTVLSLHEMIAADLFVGSMSGMSLHLVGSLNRGAMQLLPTRIEYPTEWRGHIKFDPDTGLLSEKELDLVRQYWSEFSDANEESAKRAYAMWASAKVL